MKWTKNIDGPLLFSRPGCQGAYQKGQSIRSMIVPEPFHLTLIHSNGLETIYEGDGMEEDTDDRVVAWTDPNDPNHPGQKVTFYEQMSEAVNFETNTSLVTSYREWIRNECRNGRTPNLWTKTECSKLLADKEHTLDQNDEDEEVFSVNLDKGSNKRSGLKEFNFQDMTTFDYVMFTILIVMACVLVYFIVIYIYRKFVPMGIQPARSEETERTHNTDR